MLDHISDTRAPLIFFLLVVQTIIGDSIIIWRVYAFWSNGRERLVVFVPCAFLLGSFGGFYHHPHEVESRVHYNPQRHQ
jgi:hypothetical protein